MTTTAKWFSMSKLHDQDVEMCQHVEFAWPRRRNGSARRSCRTTTPKWVSTSKLHGHDVEMGVDAMGGGGVQAVQIKSLKKKVVGAMEVWWSVPEPFQGPCCGTCSDHFPSKNGHAIFPAKTGTHKA